LLESTNTKKIVPKLKSHCPVVLPLQLTKQKTLSRELTHALASYNDKGKQGDQIRTFIAHWVICLLCAYFLKIKKVSHIFGLNFFHDYVDASMVTQMGWATIWAIFPQAHLVTLKAKAASQEVAAEVSSAHKCGGSGRGNGQEGREDRGESEREREREREREIARARERERARDVNPVHRLNSLSLLPRLPDLL
jgi:hypothetical protein